MSDFSPEQRASGWYSGDSRLAANNRANEAILRKLGRLPYEDLSDNEAVQMGHVMEPVIGSLASERLGFELRKLHHEQAHPAQPWLRSHFDFVGTDSSGELVLVEAKNYNAAVRAKFDDGVAPAADMAQLVHEAAVFGVRKTYLAVLFGGQEFCVWPHHISDEQKDALIQQSAVYWAHVQRAEPMTPETVEQARLCFPASDEGIVTATAQLEQACERLAQVKGAIKALEEDQDKLISYVCGNLRERDTLVAVDGRVLVTWKSTKPTRKFDADLFKQHHPDMFRQYEVEKPGSRRFLVKR